MRKGPIKTQTRTLRGQRRLQKTRSYIVPGAGRCHLLDYRPETLPLEPGAVVTREFTVSAPRGAAPGEYISSVVVEHDLPAQGKGIALKQVTRHAMAVAITVPGPLVAGLATGAGRHTVSAGRSLVAMEVRNTGHTHLRPKVQIVVTDAAGAVVHRGTVTMDAVYAHTNAFVEQPLDRLLTQGTYMISATLTDPAKGVSVSAAPVPFEVANAEAVAAPQTSDALPAIGRALDTIRRGEASVWLLAGVAVGLLLTGLVIALAAVSLVQRRRRAGEPMPIPVDITRRARTSEPRTELAALSGLTIGQALAGTPPPRGPRRGPRVRALSKPRSARRTP
jgi:hypothetical protein